jgi:hypothetical protein
MADGKAETREVARAPMRRREECMLILERCCLEVGGWVGW